MLQTGPIAMETIELGSKNLSQEWGDFLQEIFSSDPVHYLWLRSLSYLEYIGYRKMVKTLEHQEVNQGVYHHLTDEIRHSFLLKELAEKAFDGRFQHVPFEPRLIDIAEGYFQDVDGEVNQWILNENGQERPFLCYLLVSYIIEKRAMTVYPTYYAKLREAPAKLILQKIIKDERDHLNYLEDRMRLLPEAGAFKMSNLTTFETVRFSRFLQQFRHYAENFLH